MGGDVVRDVVFVLVFLLSKFNHSFSKIRSGTIFQYSRLVTKGTTL